MEETQKVPKNPESLPTPTPQEVAKPVKEKKPRTEAQQAATQRALAAMTARRKEINEKAKEKKEQVKEAVKVVKEKIMKEDIGFVPYKDFHAVRQEVAELRGMLTAAQQAKAAPAPKQERIVERVIERTPTAPAPPTKLTGHALLDKLFF